MIAKVRGKVVEHWRLLGLLTVFGVVAIIAACNDETRVPTGLDAKPAVAAAKESAKENPYAYVGKEHNAQVDHVLREFAKQWRKNMKKEDVCMAIEKLNADYVAKKGRSAYNFKFHASADDPCTDDKGSARTGFGGAGLKVANMSYDGNFSSSAVDLVNQVEWVLASSSSAGEVASRLGPINSAALGTLGGADAALVLSVSSIAQNSAAYWEANLGTWVQVYSNGGNPGVIPLLRSDNFAESIGGRTAAIHIDWSGISRVSSADLAGGIGGAIKGLLGGPEGVAAGAVIGASYASIGAAVGEIIKIVAKM